MGSLFPVEVQCATREQLRSFYQSIVSLSLSKRRATIGMTCSLHSILLYSNLLARGAPEKVDVDLKVILNDLSVTPYLSVTYESPVRTANSLLVHEHSLHSSSRCIWKSRYSKSRFVPTNVLLEAGVGWSVCLLIFFKACHGCSPYEGPHLILSECVSISISVSHRLKSTMASCTLVGVALNRMLR